MEAILEESLAQTQFKGFEIADVFLFPLLASQPQERPVFEANVFYGSDFNRLGTRPLEKVFQMVKVDYFDGEK